VAPAPLPPPPRRRRETGGPPKGGKPRTRAGQTATAGDRPGSLPRRQRIVSPGGHSRRRARLRRGPALEARSLLGALLPGPVPRQAEAARRGARGADELSGPEDKRRVDLPAPRRRP